jgi:hypothetical protein
MKIIEAISGLLIKPAYAAGVNLGFKIPTIPELLTFLVRIFFSIAAVAALLFLLLGAFSWVTSSGNKESVQKAQDKIQAAIVGLLLIAAVLAIGATLEQFVFKGNVCLGLTCDVKIPALLESN